MLAVARGVLERLHAQVFGVLAGPHAGHPATPPGTPDRGLAAWDVRCVLRALRAQVLRAGAPCAPSNLRCCHLLGEAASLLHLLLCRRAGAAGVRNLFQWVIRVSFTLEPCCNSPRSAARQVLAGVRILFSRVIPLERAPASHPLWQLAEAFGAQCTTEADAGVTHVVAATRGTQKVFWALQTGKHVVLPAWCAPEAIDPMSGTSDPGPGR